MKLITKALLETQKKIKHAVKDAKNPHFRNDYATLESVIDAVKEAANSCGIVILQPIVSDVDSIFVETKLIHESGEEINSKLRLILDKQNMQGLGSAMTYARRYALASIFCIAQADDDGNTASLPENIPQPKQVQKATKPSGFVNNNQSFEDFT